MDEGRRHADSPRLRNLIEKFRDKAYRDSYTAAHTRRFLARQMRKFRGEKSQSEFGNLIDKRQTVVSRLEDPKYGKWTLQTLFDVAEKLNVAVVVRFVDIPTFLKSSEDMSDDASQPQPYDEAKTASAFEHPAKKLVIRPLGIGEPIQLFGADFGPHFLEIAATSTNQPSEPPSVIIRDEKKDQRPVSLQ
jgi:hypothetical protein